jgi:hypothetical protein
MDWKTKLTYEEVEHLKYVGVFDKNAFGAHYRFQLQHRFSCLTCWSIAQKLGLNPETGEEKK